MRPTDLTDLDKRLLAYLAGGLSSDEAKAIEVELADDATAERLMRLAEEETTIRAWARAYSQSKQLDEEDAGIDAIALTHDSWWTAKTARVAALIAILIGGATALAIVFSGPTLAPGTIARVESVPDGMPTLVVGEDLKPGQRVELTTGAVELKFHHGPRVVVEGPASLELESTDAVRLDHGKVSVELPKGTSGFTVRTSNMDIVDLGTRFGVQVYKNGESQVHVFDGEVETQSTVATPGKMVERQRLSMTQAAKFNNKGKLAGWIEPDYRGFKLGGEPLGGVVSTARTVQLLTEAPKSVANADLESNNRIFLIIEKANVVLPEGVKVTFDQRNRKGGGTAAGGFTRRSYPLPAGLKVDSYLLHFRPIAPGEGALGHVTFNRPIVAIITSGKQLAATDALFGLENMKYPTTGESKTRGLDSVNELGRTDVLIFGKGQRHVGLSATVDHHGEMDQIRVLVESK